MSGIAMSRLHLTPGKFFDLTPIEFYYALTDLEEQHDNKRKFELEKMRLQTFFLINIQLKKIDQFKDPKKLMLFEHEKGTVEQPRILTEEEWKERDEFVRKIREKEKVQ